MKRNGFTLIELLAVIVILAIIALIATPIILGIINDAREEANKRSLELYASAIKNGIVAHQLRTGKEVSPGVYNEDNEEKKLPFEVEYDGDVKCTSIIILQDSTVVLDECTVTGGEKTYDYGEKLCKLSDEDKNGKYSVGDIVTCTFVESTEQFYVIEDETEDETTEGISMLAMYNLYVGNREDVTVDEGGWLTYSTPIPLENPTGIQNPIAKGAVDGDTAYYGTVVFSDDDYWKDEDDNLLPQYRSSYPAYVYNENASIYQYVNAYATYFKENGVSSASATLISYEQLEDLACYDSGWVACSDATEWVSSTSYWTGYADAQGVIFVSPSAFGVKYNEAYAIGVRPVITISTSEI